MFEESGMSNYWAIAIGINHYQHLQPLHFAQQDAQSLCESLVADAGFLPDRCILATDTSPDFSGHSTDPTRENLLYWTTFLKEHVQAEDSLWCFFSGYGVCVDGEDYLLSINADPADAQTTGIQMRSLFQSLKSLPTHQILVLLDIDRAQSVSPEKVGTQTAQLAHETGIATFLSCRPEQFSHEAAAYNHGLFTQAVIEGLRSHQCSTLAGLEDFLNSRLPELCDHNDRPVQNPVLIVSDPEQLRGVIMPVNWAETDSWTPAIDSNPFAIAGDLDLSAIHDYADYNSDTYNDLERYPTPPIMGTTATMEPSLPVLPPPEETRPPEVIPPSPEPEAPDQTFWERVLFGGSAVLLLLLLGVLFRNWSAFMGTSPQTATKTTAPPASAKTESATAPAKPVASPQTSEQILNDARSIIKPTLASDASRAIDRANRIPPNDPLYAQAQQDIDRWSRNILDIAKKRAEQRDFKGAIAAAQLVPKRSTTVYAEAQKVIPQWKQRSR